MSDSINISETMEIPEGQGRCIEVSEKRVAVFNVGGTYYAIEDVCTHMGGPLSEGDLSGTEVTCPWHGATFDVTTGKVLGGPATRDVNCYKVQVEGSKIKIQG